MNLVEGVRKTLGIKAACRINPSLEGMKDVGEYRVSLNLKISRMLFPSLENIFL